MLPLPSYIIISVILSIIDIIAIIRYRLCYHRRFTRHYYYRIIHTITIAGIVAADFFINVITMYFDNLNVLCLLI